MNDCAESQTRICKAYISDCYSYLSKALNGCKSAERHVLKANIFNMLDRVKILLDGKESTEVNSVEKTEN